MCFQDHIADCLSIGLTILAAVNSYFGLADQGCAMSAAYVRGSIKINSIITFIYAHKMWGSLHTKLSSLSSQICEGSSDLQSSTFLEMQSSSLSNLAT